MKNLPLFLKDVKKIGLFGLGKSNIGVAEFLSENTNAEFIIRSDKKINTALLPSGIKIAAVLTGERALAMPTEQALFLSPSAKRERFSHFTSKGCKLTSDAELFFDLAEAPIFAVSGSDGKSTTTELAARLLKTSFPEVLKSGNCGDAMTPFAELERENAAHIVELSSFMLEYMIPKTRRAVITNISENHLDFHGSFEKYIAAKENLLKGTDEPIIWADCPISSELSKKYPPYALLSAKSGCNELSGIDSELKITLENGKININGLPVLPVCEIRRREEHNIKNLMSAIALTYGYFSDDAPRLISDGFEGIAHRCESIGIKDGVEYIDSSIDSTPIRCAATLTGLRRRVILILGGRGKGLSYAPLAAPVAKWAGAVIICGENAAEIESALIGDDGFAKSNIPIYRVGSFDTAILTAKSLAKRGDTVLLSPASTSYDRFENFEKKSARFKELIGLY